MIPGLLRRVNILEEELNMQKLNARRLWMLLILAMGIIGWMLIGGNEDSSVVGVEDY